MEFPNLSFASDYEYEMEVQDYMICHDDGAGYILKTQEFGTLIHAIHQRDTFTAVGGNCLTCHTATADGRGMMSGKKRSTTCFRASSLWRMSKVSSPTIRTYFL